MLILQYATTNLWKEIMGSLYDKGLVLNRLDE
jgi:hypothetical protein